MKNSKLRRALMLAACAVLLVCLSVGATLAYLTSSVKEVKNTFVIGEGIEIKLDEAFVYEDGKEPSREQFGQIITGEGAGRGTENSYKLVPDWTYAKDPTVHLLKSGNCYLFVKVENGITAIEAKDNADEGTYTIETQMLANGWKQLAGVTNVWYYIGTGDDKNEAGVVVSNDTDTPVDFVVFENFTTDNYSEAPEMANLTITVDAFAIQADGFTTAAEAWADAAGENFVWEEPAA